MHIYKLIRKENIPFYSFVILSIVLRLINIRIPIGNDMHAFRQSQTAITVQNYFNDGYSFFHYETPIFGSPWTFLLEAPIYQSIVYFAMKLLNKTNIDLSARLISILFFYFSAFTLRKVIEQLTKNKGIAVFSFFIYLFSPFTLYWSRAVLIDYASVFFALMYVYGLMEWLENERNRWYFLAGVSGCLGYLCKVTTMFTYVYFLVFGILYFLRKELKTVSLITIREYFFNNIKKNICLLGLFIFPVIVGVLWMKWADYNKSKSIYELSHVASSNMQRIWNFGTLKQRLSIDCWKPIALRTAQCLYGMKTVFVVVFLYFYKFSKKNNYFFLIFTSGFTAFLTVLTLFNLYYIHNYYFIAISPLICTMLGGMIFMLYENMEFRTAEKITYFGKTVSLLILIGVVSLYNLSYNREYLSGIFKGDTNNYQHGLFLQKITESDERIIIRGEAYDSTTLYYGNRKGFMSYAEKSLDDTLFNNIINQDDYTTYITHDYKEVSLISKYSSDIVEYPRYTPWNIFYCKFSRIGDKDCFDFAKQDAYDFLECKKINDVYEIQGCNLLRVDYSIIKDDELVNVVIVDSEGNHHECKIVLIAGRENVFVNLFDICAEPMTITFDSVSNISIYREYQ